MNWVYLTSSHIINSLYWKDMIKIIFIVVVMFSFIVVVVVGTNAYVQLSQGKTAEKWSSKHDR